jgi:hypothetical protein
MHRSFQIPRRIHVPHTDNTNYAPVPTTISYERPALYKSINWGEFRLGRFAGDAGDTSTFSEDIQIEHFRTDAAGPLKTAVSKL